MCREIMEILENGLKSCGLHNAIMGGVQKQLIAFMEMVLKKNEEINLTTIIEPHEFIEKHLLDSLSCYHWEEIEAARRIVDIGTGAGFPGIPLALAYPDKNFVLIDSLRKRIDFLRNACAELKLNNVDLIHARAEDAARDESLRESFDLCVSRAVSKFSVLAEYCLPFVKRRGFFYAFKTKKALEELDAGGLALRLLGAASDVEIRESLKTGYGHIIMVVKKERTTPASYPRSAGIPAKVPLG